MTRVSGWEPNLGQESAVPVNLQQYNLQGSVNPRELARRTVYRWYRIKTTGSIDDPTKPPLIPGWGVEDLSPDQMPPADGADEKGKRIQHLWQVLPIEDAQIVGYYDKLNGQNFAQKPAMIYGTFNDPFFGGVRDMQGDATAINGPAHSFCYYDHAIDAARGIVMFSEPVWKYETDGTISPADLVLRCVVNVKNPDDDPLAPRDHDRYTFETDVLEDEQQHDTGPMLLRRDDIAMFVVPTYEWEDLAVPPVAHVASLTTNQEECDRQAAYAIDAALADFKTVFPQDITYMGLKDISPDGAIQQVSWSVGPQGAITRASRDTEWHPIIPSYRERQQIYDLPFLSQTVQQLQQQSRKE